MVSGEGRAAAPGRRRAILTFAAFGWFWGTWGAVLPSVQRHAGADRRELGLALLCIGAGALVTMRPAGALLDRRGPAALPVTVALFAATAALPALCTSVPALAAALALLGATSAAVDVAANAEAVRAEAVGPRVMQLAHGLFSAGVVAASLAAGLALGLGAGAIAISAGAAIVVAACAVVLHRLAPAPAMRAAPLPGFAALLRVPRPLAVLGALAAVAYLVENSWQSWSAVHLRTELDASASAAAIGPAAFASAAMTGRLLAQPLAGRVRDRVLLGAGAAVAGAGTLLAARAGSMGVGLAGIFVAGLGTSVCAPILLGLAGRHAAEDARAAAVSMVTTLAYLGFLLGPALVGLIAEATSLRTALTLVAGIAGALALASRLTPVPRE
jgi:predicted MFS family arabinose efflux permease